MKGLFFFGAGASYGSEYFLPTYPPLGNCLYQAIKNTFPNSWGSIDSFDDNLGSIFADNFEAGMEIFCQYYPERVANYWQDLARYFASFRLSNRKGDYYSYILRDLINKGKIDDYAFSTLNYECLLGLAINGAGRTISYQCLDGIRAKKTIVWKIHGSCNFKVKGIKARKKGMTFRINDVSFNGRGIDIICDLDSVEKYCNESAIPPCMSLYAPGKPNQVGRPTIELYQRQWANYLALADKIFIIGVAPNLADSHIWEPVSKCEGHIYYVGGAQEFKKWAKKNRKISTYTFIGETISESLTKIKELV